MTERRRHPRVPASLPLRICVEEVTRFTEEHSADLSAGGIFVRMEYPPPVETPVDVEFYFPQQKRTIRVRGRVVRSVTEASDEWAAPGAGIQFTFIDNVAKRFIELVVETYSRRHPSQDLELPEGFLDELEGLGGPPDQEEAPEELRFLSAARMPKQDFLDELSDDGLREISRKAGAYPEPVRTRARRLLKLRKDRKPTPK